MQQGGYPLGAQYESDAPWNQPDRDPMDIDVDVVMTISKRVTIKASDYHYDEDGNICVENDNLYRYVNDQVTLPTEVEGVEGWVTDDFFVQEAY